MDYLKSLAFGRSDSRMLLVFSDGGSDLVEIRGFDLDERRFDGSGFTAWELTAQSKDGTSVEYTLLSPDEASGLSNNQPVLMTGYGAFEVIMPFEYLSPAHGGITLVTWLENGGSLALPRIRGGGERGSAWHESAQREHRQR
jgi:prolyl oligopeptidase